MSTKYFTAIVIICFINFQVITGKTLDDALKAFEDLKDFVVGESYANLYDLIKNQTAIINRELLEEIDASLLEISSQTDSILSKISELAENAQENGINVDHCVAFANSDLENYVADVKLRLNKECRYLYSFNSAKIWAKYDYISKTSLRCANMSIVQCNEYENTTSCFEFVVEVIEEIKDFVKARVKDIQMETKNQSPRFTFTCKQMVVQLMDLYPSLILKYVASCVDYTTSSSFITIC